MGTAEHDGGEDEDDDDADADEDEDDDHGSVVRRLAGSRSFRWSHI